MSAVAALLPDGRLHLQHGPIDCLCRAWGEEAEVHAAYEQAARFFAGVLDGLCAELPLLRSTLPAPLPEGAIARAMHAACVPFADDFITPMAAVAGAVADAVLAAMIEGRAVTRAFVNNGGDIAFFLVPGTSLRCGLVADLASVVSPSDARAMGESADPSSRVTADPSFCVMAGLGPATHDLARLSARKSWVTGPRPIMTRDSGSGPAMTRAHTAPSPHTVAASQPTVTRSPDAAGPSLAPPSLDGTFLLTAEHKARGLATSGRACKGRGGRSFSFGIADSVSVLARTAAQADAAATIIGNAVDLPGNPAIDRIPASAIDPASDLGDRLVTFDIGYLTEDAIDAALDAGEVVTDRLLRDRLIEGAVLALGGHLRIRHASRALPTFVSPSPAPAPIVPPRHVPSRREPPSLVPLESV
jgi:ApbE superfamily uncharacterized protein (UPF0280 family)